MEVGKVYVLTTLEFPYLVLTKRINEVDKKCEYFLLFNDLSSGWYRNIELKDDIEAPHESKVKLLSDISQSLIALDLEI